MLLSSAPGPNFEICQIQPRGPDSFILASPIGKFKIYQASGEPKCPFIPFKDMPTEHDEEEWSQQIKKIEGFPFFQMAGFSVADDFVYFATKSR